MYTSDDIREGMVSGKMRIYTTAEIEAYLQKCRVRKGLKAIQ